MSSNSSIALSLVFALVLCGCESHRAVSRTPISYRQRPGSPPSAMPGRMNATPINSPRQEHARHVAIRPPANSGETARTETPHPAVAQSVVYRREDAKPTPNETTHNQAMDVGFGQLAAEQKTEDHSPSANMPPANAQADCQLPQDKKVGADKAKLKALYDSGFLTREEYLRAQNVK